jgi:hypothetical protein
MRFFFAILATLDCFASYLFATSRGSMLFSYNRLLSYIALRLFAFREVILKLNRLSFGSIVYNFIIYLLSICKKHRSE